MSTQIRIEFNSDGFKELLCSDGIQGVVESAATGIQTRANANANLSENSTGYYMRTVQGSSAGRWLGFVGATDHETLVAESEYQALTKAVGGG